MVAKCVNPFCNRPFRYLSHGKLFLVEFPPRLVERRHHRAGFREHFWLCEDCARTMTVAVRREYDSVSVRIINLATDGSTKLKFTRSKGSTEQDAAFVVNGPDSPEFQAVL